MAWGSGNNTRQEQLPRVGGVGGSPLTMRKRAPLGGCHWDLENPRNNDRSIIFYRVLLGVRDLTDSTEAVWIKRSRRPSDAADCSQPLFPTFTTYVQATLHRNSNLTPRRRPFWLMKLISAARHCAQLYSERHWLLACITCSRSTITCATILHNIVPNTRSETAKLSPLQREKEQWAHLTCRIPTGCNACGVWREGGWGWGRGGGGVRVQTVHWAREKRVAVCYVKQFLMRITSCGFGGDAHKAGTDLRRE